MIRNVVMGRLRSPGDLAAEQQCDDGLRGIAGLRLPGQLAMSVGRDVGFREGGWSFAIVNDWADAAAYRNYDVDEVHGSYRRLLGEVCVEIARVQYEI
ncbi:MAG: Dabb family protein [Actinobacteria bacterium]|nr:Dabb family protein [Actinomycetota bacterium]